MRETLRVLLAALVLAPATAGFARDDDDHERAREALAAGEIRPLRDIVNAVRSHCRGRVIEVELERGSRTGGKNGDDDIWLYQLRVMMPKGDVVRLDVDAATSKILKVKGRGAKDACQAGF